MASRPTTNKSRQSPKKTIGRPAEYYLSIPSYIPPVSFDAGIPTFQPAVGNTSPGGSFGRTSLSSNSADHRSSLNPYDIDPWDPQRNQSIRVEPKVVQLPPRRSKYSGPNGPSARSSGARGTVNSASLGEPIQEKVEPPQKAVSKETLIDSLSRLNKLLTDRAAKAPQTAEGDSDKKESYSPDPPPYRSEKSPAAHPSTPPRPTPTIQPSPPARPQPPVQPPLSTEPTALYGLASFPQFTSFPSNYRTQPAHRPIYAQAAPQSTPHLESIPSLIEIAPRLRSASFTETSGTRPALAPIVTKLPSHSLKGTKDNRRISNVEIRSRPAPKAGSRPISGYASDGPSNRQRRTLVTGATRPLSQKMTSQQTRSYHSKPAKILHAPHQENTARISRPSSSAGFRVPDTKSQLPTRKPNPLLQSTLPLRPKPHQRESSLSQAISSKVSIFSRGAKFSSKPTPTPPSPRDSKVPSGKKNAEVSAVVDDHSPQTSPVFPSRRSLKLPRPNLLKELPREPPEQLSFQGSPSLDYVLPPLAIDGLSDLRQDTFGIDFCFESSDKMSKDAMIREWMSKGEA